MKSLSLDQHRITSNHMIFKKKNLKRKISDCLHICQCGRQFLSFPAVYSHAKTKHNYKISSRIGDQGRKIIQKDSQMKIYYQIFNSQILEQKSASQLNEEYGNYKVKIKQTNSKFNFINKIRNLETPEGDRNIYATIVEFMNEQSKTFSLQGLNYTAQVMDLFTTCINQHYMHYDSSEVSKDYCNDHNASSLPYYFNFFIIWYVPSKQKQINQNIQKLKALLKIFFVWLKENHHTQLDYKKDQNEGEQNIKFCRAFFIREKQFLEENRNILMTKKEDDQNYNQIQITINS